VAYNHVVGIALARVVSSEHVNGRVGVETRTVLPVDHVDANLVLSKLDDEDILSVPSLAQKRRAQELSLSLSANRCVPCSIVLVRHGTRLQESRKLCSANHVVVGSLVDDDAMEVCRRSVSNGRRDSIKLTLKLGELIKARIQRRGALKYYSFAMTYFRILLFANVHSYS
jgi:hypothetical protein